MVAFVCLYFSFLIPYASHIFKRVILKSLMCHCYPRKVAALRNTASGGKNNVRKHPLDFK